MQRQSPVYNKQTTKAAGGRKHGNDVALPYMFCTSPSHTLLTCVSWLLLQQLLSGPLTVYLSDFSVVPLLPWKAEALSQAESPVVPCPLSHCPKGCTLAASQISVERRNWHDNFKVRIFIIASTAIAFSVLVPK